MPSLRDPDVPPGPSTHRPQVDGPSGGQRITVVNDDPDFLALMREIFAADEYHVTVINGEQIASIDPIRESRPDLLFIDLRLHQNRITGWDIARQVRGDEALRDVPIVLCTGAVDEVRERAEDMAELANVEVLAKPFSLAGLRDVVTRLLPGEGPPPPAPAGSAS